MLLTVDLDRLDVRAGQLLLDVGCGQGRHCLGAQERGAHVVGLDLDHDSLCQASKSMAGRNPTGLLLRGDALQLPFPDAFFDRVICSEVMEHVHDFEGAARELARVTKPSGRVAITIPTASSEQLYLWLSNDYFETPGGHIRIFQPRVLTKAIRSVGFRLFGLGFAHAFHTPYWLIRCWVGLPDAERSRLVRAYRVFLLLATKSKLLAQIEHALNYVCPKSWVLYAEKRRLL